MSSIRRLLHGRTLVTLITAALAFGVIGGVGAGQAADGEIHACVRDAKFIRFVSDASQCKSFEEAKSWSSRGAAGPPGADGAQWFTDDGEPSNDAGSNGDLYLDTASGDLYRKLEGTWQKVGNLQGPPGAGDGGISSIDELDGLPCNTGSSRAGHTRVGYGSGSLTADTIALTCAIDDLVTLSVVIEGAGEAEVDVKGADIDCRSDGGGLCDSQMARGTPVQLELTNSDPEEASFIQWQGCDTVDSAGGLEFCYLTMDTDRTVTAVLQPVAGP